MINIGYEDPTKKNPEEEREPNDPQGYSVEENWRGYSKKELEEKIKLYKNGGIMIATAWLDSDYHSGHASKDIPEDILEKSSRLVTNYRDPIRYVKALRDYFDIVDWYAKDYEKGIIGTTRTFLGDIADNRIKMNQPVPQYYPRNKSMRFPMEVFARLVYDRNADPASVLHMKSKSDMIPINTKVPWYRESNVQEDDELDYGDMIDESLGSFGFVEYLGMSMLTESHVNGDNSSLTYALRLSMQTEEAKRKEIEKKFDMEIDDNIENDGDFDDLVDIDDRAEEVLQSIHLSSVSKHVSDTIASSFASKSKFSFGIQSKINNFLSTSMDVSIERNEDTDDVKVKVSNSKDSKEASTKFFDKMTKVSNVIYERVKEFNSKYRNILEELYKEQERKYQTEGGERYDRDE